jgi:hypothetical protein
LSEIAMRKGTLEVCESDNNPNECYLRAATYNAQWSKTYNSEVCARINNTEKRIFCYSVHRKISNISECNLVQNVNYYYHECIVSVAIVTKDSSICNRLDSTGTKNCINAIEN